MIAKRVRPPSMLMPLPLLLAACATGYSADRGRTLEGRVEQLEATQGAPLGDADRAAARAEAKRQDARVAALESKLAQVSNTGTQAGNAERSAQVARLSEELTDAQKQLSEQRRQLDEQGRRLDGMDRAVARLEAGTVVRPTGPGLTRKGLGRTKDRPSAGSTGSDSASLAPPTQVLAPGAASISGGRAEVLALARAQEADGKHAVARDLYEEYVEKYPSDPGSAEARFQLGEIAFAERRYQDAIVQFGRVAQDFGASVRAPDALLRTAESMVAIGLNDDAKTVLSDVPRRYPNTPAAARARDRLAQLGGASKP